MSPHRDSVISSFNEYVDGLRKQAGRCYVSLYKFSDVGGGFGLLEDKRLDGPHLRTVFENRKVSEMYSLTQSQYQPNGMTPLYDAMGDLIRHTKQRLPKGAKVLFVVHTDGQENQSKKFNQEKIRQMVSKREEKRGWTFVYLGEGAQAWNAGYDFGVKNVANFSSTRRGASMQKLARATATYSMNANVGGSYGSSEAFYEDAGETPDDIDPEDQGKVASAVDPSIRNEGATSEPEQG